MDQREKTRPKRNHRLMVLLLAAAAATVGVLGWVVLRGRGRSGAPGGDTIARNLPARSAPSRASSSFVAAPGARDRAQAAVREALKRSPERLSTTAALPPFDRDAFARV